MRAEILIVLLREQPAGPWTHAEHVEKVSTDEFSPDAFSLISISDIHLHAATREHARKNGITIAQIFVHEIREGAVDIWSILRVVCG